ncbi:KAP family P-loop domain protein [Mariniflexile rhizosphaerae]|uniref:KAP family P-loop NTPase fold protein n=1 Tax=unclassified Mariniflexile TaxID=2643887 RepID=UPI000CAC4EC7|nr:P-loop NTPase fold protein [Mariniflexile sp. TRM1-10]AXP82144.1 KAP family P-loop domain protein [Mariniflexile sp. TRM1-10]PLB20211.1 MAG: KAP P-loop domain protein [Flavobacteriaceae bacterium FS1-H7996/R]
MWADNETSEDLLGFKVHADLLVDVINDDKVLPVTIGVFGDWGSGKSSILKIVEQELTGGEEDGFKDGTLVLYFNGWVFEGYDDAKAALLESIIEKFDKHKTIGNKVKDKTKKLFKSVKWMRLLGLSFKKVIVPGASAYLTGGASLLPFLVNEFSQLQPKDVAEKLTGEGAEDFLKEIIKKNEDEEVTIVREFRDDFKEMIDKSGIKKLVVIIDDLDRCTPDRLIENLEAIKLFLNVEKTAFVIGADPRIVRHAIEHRYRTDSIENADDPDSRNKRIVSDYLEKLIQIPYYLPKLTDNEVETYLTLLFCKKAMENDFPKVIDAFKTNRENNRYDVFGLGDIQEIATEEQRKELTENVSLIASLSPIITEGLKGNPRQIKRFLNTFTLRNRLVKVAKLSDFKIDILAKLMVLEYASTNLFKEIYNWQSLQKGEPKQIIELEKLAGAENTEEIKKQFSTEWASEKVMKWVNAEPKLANVDLRDYYWISRDQLSTTISGASLIPPHIRSLTKKLINHGSGSILENTITQEVIGKLNETENEILLSLLEKELIKFPENDSIHKVFIEMMSKNASGIIESYGRAIAKADNRKIPFSLRSEFTLAEGKNKNVKSLYSQFEKTSQIYKALNSKK